MTARLNIYVNDITVDYYVETFGNCSWMSNFTILVETHMENLWIIMGHLKFTLPKFELQWNQNLNMTDISNIYSLRN